MTKLWIDDLRSPPDDDWHWVKTSSEAIEYLRFYPVCAISFDHDLGGDDTSMRVVDWIDNATNSGLLPPFEWFIHSANPIGRRNIHTALTRICERFEDGT
jgi:hypothetical protein